MPRPQCLLQTFVLALVVAAPALSQEPAKRDTVTSVSTSPEVLVLRAQVAQMKESDDRLLSTVHWSLGVTAAVGLALVGFGWFANFKLHDREITTLREEVGRIVEEQVRAQREQISASLMTEVQSAVAEVKKKLEGRIEHAQHGVMMLMYDDAADDAAEREKAGNKESALSAHNVRAAAAIVLGDKEKVASSLDSMRRLLKAGAEPSAKLAAQINTTIERAPATFAADKDVITELIRKNRT